MASYHALVLEGETFGGAATYLGQEVEGGHVCASVRSQIFGNLIEAPGIPRRGEVFSLSLVSVQCVESRRPLVWGLSCTLSLLAESPRVSMYLTYVLAKLPRV